MTSLNTVCNDILSTLIPYLECSSSTAFTKINKHLSAVYFKYSICNIITYKDLSHCSIHNDKDPDILEIIRTWRFHEGNALTSF